MRNDEMVSPERVAKIEDLPVVDGEILEIETNSEAGSSARLPEKSQKQITGADKARNQRFFLQNVFLPVLFLTAALLGGLRISAADSAFVFLKPALVCLIFAALLLILFFRAKLIRLEGWFSEDFSGLKNAANATILLSLYAASVQVFNSLLPEQGLPFWIIAFCFFWTLWNNLFAEFDTRRLLQSLGGLFGLAFVIKYLVLANLAAPVSESWWRGILENPTKEAFTWLLDLPRFSPATGYIHFFTLIFYLIGLFLLKPDTREN